MPAQLFRRENRARQWEEAAKTQGWWEQSFGFEGFWIDGRGAREQERAALPPPSSEDAWGQPPQATVRGRRGGIELKRNRELHFLGHRKLELHLLNLGGTYIQVPPGNDTKNSTQEPAHV